MERCWFIQVSLYIGTLRSMRTAQNICTENVAAARPYGSIDRTLKLNSLRKTVVISSCLKYTKRIISIAYYYKGARQRCIS